MGRRRGAPLPPAGGAKTLAGVSAEDLLGEDGRRMLAELHERERQKETAEHQALPDRPTRKVQGTVPGMEDLEDDSARLSQVHEQLEQRAGYMLWLQGVITEGEVEEALKSVTGESVSPQVTELLEASGFPQHEMLYRFLARHESIAPVDLDRIRPTQRALRSVKPGVARSYRAVPIDRIGRILLVAVSLPYDPRKLLELRSLTSSKVKLFVASEEDVNKALDRYFPAASGERESTTGAGLGLEQRYDPTVGGYQSGLYSSSGDSVLYGGEGDPEDDDPFE
ncbi:MAG: hypothetical protein OEY28_09020 [Nitrospira sp.]|nr:hypothetical protein [Nitrospira sp.]